MQGSSLMVAALVDPEWPKRWSRQGEQAPIVLGVAVLTLGILSVVPGSRATKPRDGDANGNATGEPFAADKGLPFLTTENSSFGTVTKTSAEAAEADKLASNLPARSPRSSACRFRQMRILATALRTTATSSPLTFSRSFRSQSAKTGT